MYDPFPPLCDRQEGASSTSVLSHGADLLVSTPQGFLVFLGFYVLTSFAIIIKMRGEVSSYTPMKWPAFLVSDAASHALSFTLFWTMLYTLVYIY